GHDETSLVTGWAVSSVGQLDRVEDRLEERAVGGIGRGLDAEVAIGELIGDTGANRDGVVDQGPAVPAEEHPRLAADRERLVDLGGRAWTCVRAVSSVGGDAIRNERG